ncbi:MAG: 50S ribosomal protein L30 [Ruminococcaceae bacterium]|nr:50S ribosomal protein L30 [Oscillospiraceae bacterium]
MAKIKVTLIKSPIGCKKDQIATVEALGLKKIRDEKIHEDCAQIMGMVKKINHLVSVEEL